MNPKPSTKNRVPELDGLRGVAILLVVFFHYLVQHLQTRPGSLPAYAQKYCSICWMGVDIFFVLSGFLVGGILMDARGAKNFFGVFYLRRALRIVPPYLLFLVMLILALAVWHRTQPAGMRWLMENTFPLWSFVLYVQNFLMAQTGTFGPNFSAMSWSLAVEEQFYLLFPLVVYFCPPRKLPPVLIFCAVSATVVRLAVFWLNPDHAIAGFVLLPARWDSLALGALAAWCIRNPAAVSAIQQHTRSLHAALIAVWLGVALLPAFGSAQFSWVMFGVGYLLIAAATSLLIALLGTGQIPGISTMLRNAGLRYFGKISYTVYLLHQAVFGLTFVVLFKSEPVIATPAHALATFGAFAVTVLLAQSTWMLYEKRLIAFGHRFAYVRQPESP